VGVEEELLPVETALHQNSPNPVVDETGIPYTLSERTRTNLRIYDITGKLVRTLIDEVQSTGGKEVLWDRRNQNGESVPSGIYFYKLDIGNRTLTKTMVVL